MRDIDFLPNEYRQKHRRRRSQPWQIVAATAVIGLVIAAAVGQHLRLQRARAELDAVVPIYDSAVKLQNRLADVQSELMEARACAELYTYLRHPWPRTQLIAALLGPLPDEIAFLEVRIFRDIPKGSSPAARTALESEAEKKARESLPPARRDLEYIRGRVDSAQTVVVLSGTATDSAALHRYLNTLDDIDLFDKAELDSLSGDEEENHDISVHFRAMLAVRPGYGQPGGPAEGKNIAVANNPITNGN